MSADAGQVWVINRYVNGNHSGTVSAHTSFPGAKRTLDLINQTNEHGYEQYLINDVPFLPDQEQGRGVSES